MAVDPLEARGAFVDAEVPAQRRVVGAVQVVGLGLIGAVVGIRSGHGRKVRSGWTLREQSDSFRS